MVFPLNDVVLDREVVVVHLTAEDACGHGGKMISRDPWMENAQYKQQQTGSLHLAQYSVFHLHPTLTANLCR